MKVLAIVGSPHKRWGSCYQITAKMLERCEELGAETEAILLQQHKIHYCIGCGTCLVEGECKLKDDAQEIQEKMRQADGIVLASPVYVLHVTGLMKNFIDRCLPMGHRPSLHGKYAASISAYAGVGDIDAVADYMLNFLAGQGAYPVGKVCAFTPLITVKDEDLNKGAQLGNDMISAIREKKDFDWEGFFRNSKEFQAMKTLITEGKDFFKEDYKYWKEKGWLDD
jgi:multimeric flavodoxin WrbA